MSAEYVGLPVEGYKPQSSTKVDLVNVNKKLEELVLKVLDELSCNGDLDHRWLKIGRTHIEQGFMAINRAVFVPDRAKLVVGDKFIVNRLEVEVKNLGEINA